MWEMKVKMEKKKNIVVLMLLLLFLDFALWWCFCFSLWWLFSIASTVISCCVVLCWFCYVFLLSFPSFDSHSHRLHFLSVFSHWLIVMSILFLRIYESHFLNLYSNFEIFYLFIYQLKVDTTVHIKLTSITII